MLVHVSNMIIPLLILSVLLYGTYKKVPTYEAFVEGGKEGVSMAVSLLPFLLGMLVSITIFRASGALDALFICWNRFCPFSIFRRISYH